ncbi:MAG: hypothetical protein J6S67_10700 [Methanobrevibacter sp.]|nr:hypothetical protein [Methanobrevibacter sp.]
MKINDKGNIKKTIQFKQEYDELITKLFKGLQIERQDLNNLIIGAGINQIIENVKVIGISEYESQKLKGEILNKLNILKGESKNE